jgi:hypothetical protein
MSEGDNYPVRSIAAGAFADCGGLTAVTLQAFTPPTLGEAAFAGVTPSCTFACPASALPDYRGDAAWEPYFPSDLKIDLPDDLPAGSGSDFDFKIVTIDGVSTATITGFSGGAAAAAARTTLAIPATVSSAGVSYPVTAIGEGAFQGCRSLISVTFPSAPRAVEHPPGALTAIGTQAFANCTGLYILATSAGTQKIQLHP